MKKFLKNNSKLISFKIAPILVIVFALSMLIGGTYFVFAFGTGTAPNITPSDPWTNNVNRGVSPGEVLTAAKWNSLVNQVGEINRATTWKLAAKSTDTTEEARIEIYQNDLGITTDSGYELQNVNGHVFSWPSANTQELLFIARNDHDHFCAGGGGTLNLTGGAGTYANCLERFYRGSNRFYYVRSSTANWISLWINGVQKNECVSPDFPYSTVPAADYNAHPGRFVRNYNGVGAVNCYYSRSTATNGRTWTGNITALRI